MRLFSFSLRSKRIAPPLETVVGARLDNVLAETGLYEISEFGELSWTSGAPLGQNLPTSDDTHSHTSPVLNTSNDSNDVASVPNGTQDRSVDTLPAKCQATATFMPPGLFEVANTLSPDGEGCSRSIVDSVSSTSTSKSPSDPSLLCQLPKLTTHLLHRGQLPPLKLSIPSPSFPLVPPVSDEMIDALTVSLERDYQRTLDIRGVDSISSSSSSANTSWSDLFEASSQTSTSSECTTPDTEWSPLDSDWMTQAQQPSSAADMEKFTVRLVSPTTSRDLDCLPLLKKWDASSDGRWQNTGLRGVALEQVEELSFCDG